MIALSRETRLGIGILLLLVLVTIYTATQRGVAQKHPPLSTLSSAPDGALALKLWVDELGYEVKEDVLDKFVPPANTSILFMLEPSFPTEDEMKSLDDWVEAGGTLILIGEEYGAYSAMDHYDFFFDYDPNDNDLVRISAPLFLSPSSFAPDKLQTHIILGTQRDDYVTQMTKQGAPALVSFEQGDGRVILGTLTHPFSNAGLKEAENPEQVLNILALAKNKGPVWFDEWHHGVQGKSQILGPGEFLRHTPTGRAMLFASFAVLIVLFMQGRAFGKPVPLAHEVKRRGAMEHVTGIANLSRRASHRSSVMMNYHQQIKRKLGHRYRLDPGMDDELYVDKLSEYNPSIDKNELLKLLKRLKRKDLSEAEMVNLAAEASKWIDR